MMEHVGGYDVLQAMRAAGDHTPVMMLSGKSDEMDQVLSLIHISEPTRRS